MTFARLGSYGVRYARVAAVVLAAALAGACGGGDGDGADTAGLTPFRMMFAVTSATQYHPFYIARELGYFADEGLDVEFQTVAGSSSAIQQLIAGNADAALPAPGAFLNAAAAGHDLKWVFSYQYSNIFTLVAPADSGITSIADLEGKTVGVSELSAGEVPLVRALLRNAGLEEARGDVRILPVGEGAALTVNALKTGRVDAYSSNLFDVATIRTHMPITVILPDEVEQYPANGVVVTAQTLNEKRDALTRFLRALVRGVKFARANDAEARRIAAQVAPEEFDDASYADAAWEAARTLKTPPPELASAPVGSHPRKGFQAYHDFLLEGREEEGALSQPVDLDRALVSSLLPEANTPDPAAAGQQ